MSFNIDDVLIEEATVTLDFPGVNGARITIARISEDLLNEIRQKSVTGKVLNLETKTFEDKVDNEKFLKLYSDVVIKRWTGLKGKHLKDLILCNIPEDMLDQDVDCNAKNKFTLMSKSTELDGFISSTLRTVSLFNQEIEEAEAKKSVAG